MFVNHMKRKYCFKIEKKENKKKIENDLLIVNSSLL